ncbi:hypothetical protein H5T87_08760 [bacterium]|nr:hypothetical protein [bacterium]
MIEINYKGIAFFIFLISFLFSPIFAQQTSNYELRIVPAPGQVIVDGNLNDWDLSGEILMCYDLSTLLNTHSVRVAGMWDTRFLYLSFHFKDTTPLLNHIDPKTRPGEGWKSDCVQLRILTDWDVPIHIDAYYYTDEKRPVMFIQYADMSSNKPPEKIISDGLEAGAIMAFKKDDDGKGYFQEMAIPWKLLRPSGQPYKPGESFRLGIECFWGDKTASRWYEHRVTDLINPEHPQREFFWMNSQAWGTARIMAEGHLQPSPSIQQVSMIEKWLIQQYSTEGPVPIRYNLPEDGYVTLVIEKPDGTRVKNLISDYPRKKGENVDYWDGTDDNGHLVEPGEYRVRGLFHKDLDVLYEFAIGNPGNPPYDDPASGRGGWLSNHASPMAVACDEEGIYIAAPFAEGATTVMKLDYDGQKQWGVGNINGGMLVTYRGYLYMLVGGPTIAWGGPPANEVAIVRFDAKTGNYANFSDGKSMHTIATIPSQENWFKPRPPEGEVVAKHLFNAEWCQRQTMGLTVAKGKLYASLYYENKIVVVDPEEGKPIGEIAIPHPAGLASDRRGNLYALSDGKVVVIDAESGKITPLVKEGLSAPVGLACDAQGNIYVSDWGDAMCVKVFSPEGKFLRRIGKLGGRPLIGKYDPEGMFLPWGIAVDAKGRLWVAEYDNTPRRISVWDSRTGRLIREYCGSTWYGGMGVYINKFNPKQAFVMGNICDVDWDKGLWRVRGTLWRITNPRSIFGLNREGQKMEVVRIKGRDLLIASGSGGFFCVAELKGDYAKPLCAMGLVYSLYQGGARWPEIILKNLVPDPRKLEELQKKHPNAFNGMGSQYLDVAFMLGEPGVRNQFIWVDENGDGLVQDDEIQFFNPDEFGGLRFSIYWRAAYNPKDLTVYAISDWNGRLRIWALPVERWNNVGAPVYDIKKAKLIVDQPILPQPEGPSEWADSKGNVLIDHLPLQMFSPEGKLLWSYPNDWPGVHGSHTAPQAKRGRLIGPLYVLGSGELKGIGEIFCMGGNMGERYLMTTDGLYIGSVFRDCRSAPDMLPDEPKRGMSVNDTTAGGEPFGGDFFLNPLDGNFYIVGPVSGGRECAIITRLVGLDTVRRLPTQRLVFSQEDYEKAMVFLREKAGKQSFRNTLRVAEMKKQVSEVPNYDDFDWSDPRVATLRFDPLHYASATWSYDESNLYLCFRDIRDDTPMINNGSDPLILFKTGDALEFELRVQPNDNSAEIIPGDLRLIISVFQGKPIAVLYRYKVPGTEKPIEFTSPVTTTKIDQVKILEDAKIAIDRWGNSYGVRVVVPLSELGFKPEPGKTYRGDFGVVYSDKTGRTDELRMYWSNPVSGLVSDLALEANITPSAWGWFQLEE